MSSLSKLKTAIANPMLRLAETNPANSILENIKNAENELRTPGSKWGNQYNIDFFNKFTTVNFEMF